VLAPPCRASRRAPSSSSRCSARPRCCSRDRTSCRRSARVRSSCMTRNFLARAHPCLPAVSVTTTALLGYVYCSGLFLALTALFPPRPRHTLGPARVPYPAGVAAGGTSSQRASGVPGTVRSSVSGVSGRPGGRRGPESSSQLEEVPDCFLCPLTCRVSATREVSLAGPCRSRGDKSSSSTRRRRTGGPGLQGLRVHGAPGVDRVQLQAANASTRALAGTYRALVAPSS
jgi:hypothetical protein